MRERKKLLFTAFWCSEPTKTPCQEEQRETLLNLWQVHNLKCGRWFEVSKQIDTYLLQTHKKILGKSLIIVIIWEDTGSMKMEQSVTSFQKKSMFPEFWNAGTTINQKLDTEKKMSPKSRLEYQFEVNREKWLSKTQRIYLGESTKNMDCSVIKMVFRQRTQE